jgi:hypothetical protein
MGWLQRLFQVDESSLPYRGQDDHVKHASTNAGSMSPGLTGLYDWNLREMAGERQPPVPPECMGLHGEYDIEGLAKRVAATFDQVPELQNIQTIEIIQNGGKIILKGAIESQDQLEQLVELASQVDGTKEVDVRHVVTQR